MTKSPAQVRAPLRVSTDPRHYLESHRRSLVNPLKAWWNDRSLDQRREVYGRWHEGFEIVESHDQADIVLLPMKWNYYVDQGRVDQVLDLADQARAAGKPLIVVSEGDWTATLPSELRDVHLWQPSTYRSRALPNERAMPPLLQDLLPEFCPDGLVLCEQSDQPSVAFCGQAGGSALTFAARRTRVLVLQLRYRMGLDRWQPMPFETTALRARAVAALAESDRVQARFLIRERYFFAANYTSVTESGLNPRQEFIQNLLSSPYALCVRGSGNYSLRFFEALCLGRLPLLLDTDCLLPFEDWINWDRVCIRVPSEDFRRNPAVLGQALAEFHSKLEPGELPARQKLAREIWQSYLDREGFYEALARTYQP